MNINNTSTNQFTFIGHWPDGSMQTISLQGGQSLHVPVFQGLATFDGVSYSTQMVSDSYTHMYQVVVDVNGAFIHEDYNTSAFIMAGFYWAIPFVFVWLLIWAAVKGLRVSSPDMD